MEPKETVVVGAGPTGLMFSRIASHKGVEVYVLEEHREIGVPNHCAGLVSIPGIANLNINPGPAIQNVVRGAVIFSPSCKHKLVIDRGKKEAYVLNREIFDKEIYCQAISSGAHVKTRSKVLDLKLKHDYWYIKTINEIIKSKFLINAEGAAWIFTRKLIGRNLPKRLSAIQFELKGLKNLETDFVEIYLGNKWAPGFFAWLIPIDEKTARIGLATKEKPALKYLENLLKRHPALNNRLNQTRITRVSGGVVITSGPLKKTYGERFILIGDAAGIVKPTTGGGIVTGCFSAMVAGAVVAEEISSPSPKLDKYEKSWREFLWKDLYIMKKVRYFIDKLSDDKIDYILKIIKEHGIYEIKRFGDMDFQGKLFMKFLSNPRLIAKLLSAILFR